MQFGIIGQDAPSLRLEDWVNAKGEAVPAFRLEDHADKVRVLYFFQAWCPSCHSRGFPLLKRLMDHYADGSVTFAAVQTVFEGHRQNGPEKRAIMAREFGVDLPIGHDEGRRTRPVTIRDYRTGGTPWLVVIDRTGKVAFNDYHAPFEQIRALIDGLATGNKSAPPPAEDRLRHEPGRGLMQVDFHGGGTGRLDYDRRGDVAYLMHTEVPASMRGQGLGGRLMERTLEEFEAQGVKVHPVCSYTAAYLRRYQRWAGLLA